MLIGQRPFDPLGLISRVELNGTRDDRPKSVIASDRDNQNMKQFVLAELSGPTLTDD